MGSFAYACCISGLPIECGDSVRYFLLNKNPYHDASDSTCYVNDLWFPRTFPLRGEYNDYGSIENITDGPEKDLWLKGLKIDLVERGWGENSCHDVPTKYDMSFDKLLEAVWEGRVLVSASNNSKISNEKFSRRTKVGCPTISYVEKLAKELEIKQYSGDFGKGAMIDSPQYNEVRVRWHGDYSNDYTETICLLEKLQSKLGEYATLISSSSAALYDGGVELLIRPKPRTKSGGIGLKHSTSNQQLPVGQAMIREDVWKNILKMSVESWVNKKTVELGIDAYRDGIRKIYSIIKARNEKLNLLSAAEKSKEMMQVLLEDELNDARNIPGSWIVKNTVPAFLVGLGTNFKLMMENNLVTDELLNTIAEFAFIHDVLIQCRYQWRPSTAAGPQSGEWKRHELLFNSFASIAKNVANKKEAEYR